jgi:preprotein translocase subunit SecG
MNEESIVQSYAFIQVEVNLLTKVFCCIVYERILRHLMTGESHIQFVISQRGLFMKKVSAILTTIFIASIILLTTACSQPEGTSGSDSTKPANNSNASQNTGSKTNSSMGSIKVGSRPTGATILLIAAEGSEAGKPQTRGTSPSTVTDLVPGKYTVFLELKGYKPFEKAVEVKAGETVPVTADLQK